MEHARWPEPRINRRQAVLLQVALLHGEEPLSLAQRI
jgi:hypothetical protein